MTLSLRSPKLCARAAATTGSDGFATVRQRFEADHERLVARTKALSSARKAKLNVLWKQVDLIARDDVKFLQDIVGTKTTATTQPDWSKVEVDFEFEEEK